MSTKVDVTPEMIAAGINAYRSCASHDDLSFSTLAEVVEEVLRAGLAVAPKTATQDDGRTRLSPDTSHIGPLLFWVRRLARRRCFGAGDGVAVKGERRCV